MTATLVLPAELIDEIDAVTRMDSETAGVLLARVAQAPNGDIRVLGRQIRWVGDGAYLRREHDGLTIASDGYVHALAEAETQSSTCLWMHTHPGSKAIPLPSEHDDVVDDQLADLFRLRSGSPYYGALIFSPREPGVAFSGYLQHESSQAAPIERLWRVGERWRLTRAFDSALQPLAELFDRNVRAFGSAVQDTLNDLRIAIVGCGGTGSAVAEQLVRLGVRNLTLVDPDRLSTSNLTRVYGSTYSQVGMPKVQVLAEHLTRIARDLECEILASMITVESSARALTSCDVIFGCTDDNAGRLVLSRLATYFMTPVIDCGVLLSSDTREQLIGIDGRVTTLAPGYACLVCRNRIDMPRAAAELLTPEERRRRADEGYAPALLNTEPAVVAYTTLVAATAVAELLERLVAYGPTPAPSEVLLRCHEREVSTNVAMPRSGHYCDPTNGKMGLGMTQPFLEQVWSS